MPEPGKCLEWRLQWNGSGFSEFFRLRRGCSFNEEIFEILGSIRKNHSAQRLIVERLNAWNRCERDWREVLAKLQSLRLQRSFSFIRLSKNTANVTVDFLDFYFCNRDIQMRSIHQCLTLVQRPSEEALANAKS